MSFKQSSTMADPTSDGDNASDRIEAALVNMQPLRDLARNWDIDIASFLEDYLQEIAGHLEDDDAHMHDGSEEGPPNFAQAALLLQNSSNVYSRKVEYLYSLVYAALDDLASSGVATKHQRKTADASIDEFNNFDPDMQFLLLDDVLPTDQTEGGDKINLNEADNDLDYSRARSSSVTRLSLGGMSVTHLDRSGVAPTNARNLMTSLGDSGGGNLRLLNGNCDVGDHGMLIMPGTAVPGSSVRDATNDETTPAAAHDDNDDDEPMMLDDDDDDGGAGFQLADDDDDHPTVDNTEPPVAQQAPTLVVEKKKADPWALLDPHDVGTTKPKPLKIGVTYRLPEGLTEPPSKSVTGSHTRRRTLPIRKPVERRSAPVVSIATETFKATVANRRHQQHVAMTMTSMDDKDSVDGSMNDSSMFQTVVARPKVPLKGLAYGDEFAYIAKANAKRKAAERRERRKLLVQEPDQQQQAPDEADNLFGFDDYDDDSVGGGGNFDDDGMSNTEIAPLNDAYGSPDARDTSNLDAIEFEALCRAHIKAFAKGAEKYATETNLTKRVGDWQSRLAPILEEEEQRPEFNIHNYGDKVIEIMEHEIESKNVAEDPKLANVVSFKEITRDCPHYEVCRLFLASLNLSSAGNVAFRSESMNSIDLKLLNTEVSRPMETYMAPSATTVS